MSAAPLLKQSRLAIEGSAPVRDVAWPAWPVFEPDELEAASAVLRSGKVNYWTGELGREFESQFAQWVGAKHAIAVSNGTVALELILHGLGIGPGMEVIVPSRTFVATANAVTTVGAQPVFADVCRDSGNVTPQTIAAVISPKTRGVIAVHLAGWPADCHGIADLCKAEGLMFVEDCAQAHDARLGEHRVGSFGDAAAFSFCQDKIMTTAGEGGMIVTNHDEVWRRAWSRKDHGKSWAEVHRSDHPTGFRWLHHSGGTNARLTEVQAAVGIKQLGKVAQWVDQRRANAAQMINRLSGHDALRIVEPRPPYRHAFYRMYAYVRPEALRSGWDRDRIMASVAAEGVPCQSGSCSEVYREAAFQSVCPPRLPANFAAELGRTSLAFLVHHTVGAADMNDLAAAVTKVLEQATR
ncbi:MAG: DegT/DnrJ/EryC1/StrS aminotransferase family protein [Nannocystaceae bacterium]